MIEIRKLDIKTPSMITHDDFQLIVLEYDCNQTMHLLLNVYDGENIVASDVPVSFSSGEGRTHIMLPCPKHEFDAVWEVVDREKNIIYRTEATWKKPREWKFYIMISSHTDIGLHNSQYIQRFNSCKFLDEAMVLCDATENEQETDKYRYTVEGSWFLNNYGMDRTNDAKKNLVDNYIKTGKIGVCCGVAGNHIQTYGLEEMCRSTYERRRMLETWGVNSQTLTMIDNNGLAASMIQPYVEAGYKNIIFAPNHWNPLPSSVWQMDRTQPSYKFSTNAGGGGSRIDISYNSEMPMVFYWEDDSKNRILIWASTQYNHGCSAFGLYNAREFDEHTIPEMEQKFSSVLPKMERKYPYDIWFAACYWDDQEPSLHVVKTLKEWNKKWKYPQLQALGDPDKPFELLRRDYHDKIPVLKGDITGGWYQHPVSVAEILSKKFNADRSLPTAEKWSTIASLLDETYEYPSVEFRRAWDYLLYNDEHSYGTSGYSGRRVYETWIQHNDWIEKATYTADNEINNALKVIASKIQADEKKMVVFNQTLQNRVELIEEGNKFAVVTVPPMGYTTISMTDFTEIDREVIDTNQVPEIENKYYRISFCENGSIMSIYDKELNRELLDENNLYKANELIYTKDNHRTFSVPGRAKFVIEKEPSRTKVIIRTKQEQLGCDLVQEIVLLHFEKRIDIDNHIYHAQDMVNSKRYDRYIYIAFPFMVQRADRLCHLNGTVLRYAKDVTGHGTDVYMAVNEWCCSQNEEFGVALTMLDTQLVEFDHIHTDKTDFANAGEGSQMFVYAANDWLQMHLTGGSHLEYRFRFSITSYKGDYRTAGVPQMVERISNPVYTVNIDAQKGRLSDKYKSFMEVDTNLRLICLKRADDGNGIIARFYGDEESLHFNEICDIAVDAERNTIDEQKYVGDKRQGFVTYRLGAGKIRLREREIKMHAKCDNKPADIGSVYTGLITQPRAARGEVSGQLYLLWGQNTEVDFSHYKLYRSESPNFVADDSNHIADVFPEEYVVARYEDKGLKSHTCYYYKVCAVNKIGICGEMSKEFFAYTKEEGNCINSQQNLDRAQ